MSLTIDGHIWIPVVPNWSTRPKLTRKWQTEITSTAKKAEKRSSLRSKPLSTLEVFITSQSLAETSTLDHEIRAALKAGKACLPFHGRGVNLASDSNGSSITLKDNLWDWRAGGYMCLFNGSGLAGLAIITTVSGNTMTLLPLDYSGTSFPAATSTIWPLFFGRPSVPSGFDPITSRAGDMRLVVSQFEPWRDGYVKIPDAAGDPVDEPVDISQIPVGWTDEQATRAPYSEIDGYQGTPQQFVPTLWYSNLYFDDNDPNTMSPERVQFLIDVLLWEFENFKRTTSAVIGGHSGITWQSANFGLFYSAESARLDQSTLNPAGYPAGISQFNPGADQAYTLVLYYDELAASGNTPTTELPFNPDTPPEAPPDLFSTFDNRLVIPPACDTNDKAKTYQFDLRQLDIGFNATSINPLQEHVVHGLESKRYLLNEFQIVRDDLFFERIGGNAESFWFPAPFEEVEVVASVSTTQFKIRYRNFTQEYDDQPAKYLEIRRKSDDSVHYSKITTVANNGDGTETVTLTTSASPGVAVGDAVRVLHLVRLAGAEERIEYIDEMVATRPLRMIELPYEYGLDLTVDEKVYLYRFSCNGTTWNYTSFEEDIGSTFGGSFDLTNFTPAPINHGSIKKSIKAEREDIQIEAVYGQVEPLGLWVPMALSQPMWVEIFETTKAAPTIGRCLFYGRIQSVSVEGRKLIVKASSILDALADQFPRFIIGPRCNHHVFEAGCWLNRASYADTVDVDSISGVQVTVSNVANDTAGYFTHGLAEALADHNKEVRTILKSEALGSGVHRLYLNIPFKRVTTSDQLVIYPGCDGLLATCNSKFSNTDNFGGHPYVPQNNLTIKAMNVPAGTGGKK